MKQNKIINIITALVICISPVTNNLFAQENEQKVTATILKLDSLFWTSYNKCDLASFKNYFTADVEFYHDKSGMSQGLESMVTAMKNNLCSNGTNILRREAVAGSVQVFTLKNSGKVYGAIISGEHLFYIKGKADGKAKFTHVWLLKDSIWKMTRILSYDHGPAPDEDKRKSVVLTDAALEKYTGQYKGPQTGLVTVQKVNTELQLRTDKQTLTIYPQTENLFYAKEGDLTFEFVKNEKGNVSKMIVRQQNQVVEEAIYISK